MRTLGLLGGMSWESTLPYYRYVNERVRERLGGLHSARLVLYSVDFADIAALQASGAWDESGAILARAAQALQRAGAEALVICTNTMHKVAPLIEAGCGLPLLHIGDSIARRIRAAGMHRVGLLATGFTMEQSFYRDRLAQHGIETIVPEATDRAEVHRVIYDELCRGVIRAESRERYQAIMAGLVERGAQGMILGCTEIGLLVGPADTTVPTFDTTRIHAEDAADWALAAC